MDEVSQDACFAVRSLRRSPFTIESRTGEIAVRMALGASPRQTLALVLRDGLRPVLGGILVGLALAVAAVRWLESMLFGVSPFDALAFAGVPVVLLAVRPRRLSYRPAARPASTP